MNAKNKDAMTARPSETERVDAALTAFYGTRHWTTFQRADENRAAMARALAAADALAPPGVEPVMTDAERAHALVQDYQMRFPEVLDPGINPVALKTAIADAFAAIRAETAERIKALEAENARLREVLNEGREVEIVRQEYEARLAAAKAEGQAEMREEAETLLFRFVLIAQSGYYRDVDGQPLFSHPITADAEGFLARSSAALPTSPAPATEETRGC